MGIRMPEERKTRLIDTVVAGLKEEVFKRCAERIEAARTKPKDEKAPEEEHGITTVVKRRRGL